MKHKLVSMVAMASVALMPAIAYAQKEQTKESAQEFLKQTSNQIIKYDPGYLQSTQDRTIRNYSKVIFNGSYYKDNSHYPCISSMTSYISYVYDMNYYGGPKNLSEKTSGPDSIDWRYANKVERFGNIITIIITSGRRFITYSTEEMATRAAFAMEFLRQQCDQTADLAF